MDKTPYKFTKDPNRQEAVRKGRGKCMNKLKENILNDPKTGEDTSNDTTDTNTICHWCYHKIQ